MADQLQDPTAQFDLVFPLPPRNPVLPSVATPKSPIPSLEEVELIPAALIRLRPSGGPQAILKGELRRTARQLTSSPLI